MASTTESMKESKAVATCDSSVGRRSEASDEAKMHSLMMERLTSMATSLPPDLSPHINDAMYHARGCAHFMIHVYKAHMTSLQRHDDAVNVVMPKWTVGLSVWGLAKGQKSTDSSTDICGKALRIVGADGKHRQLYLRIRATYDCARLAWCASEQDWEEADILVWSPPEDSAASSTSTSAPACDKQTFEKGLRYILSKSPQRRIGVSDEGDPHGGGYTIEALKATIESTDPLNGANRIPKREPRQYRFPPMLLEPTMTTLASSVYVNVIPESFSSTGNGSTKRKQQSGWHANIYFAVDLWSTKELGMRAATLEHYQDKLMKSMFKSVKTLQNQVKEIAKEAVQFSMMSHILKVVRNVASRKEREMKCMRLLIPARFEESMFNGMHSKYCTVIGPVTVHIQAYNRTGVGQEDIDEDNSLISAPVNVMKWAISKSSKMRILHGTHAVASDGGGEEDGEENIGSSSTRGKVMDPALHGVCTLPFRYLISEAFRRQVRRLTYDQSREYDDDDDRDGSEKKAVEGEEEEEFKTHISRDILMSPEDDLNQDTKSNAIIYREYEDEDMHLFHYAVAIPAVVVRFDCTLAELCNGSSSTNETSMSSPSISHRDKEAKAEANLVPRRVSQTDSELSIEGLMEYGLTEYSSSFSAAAASIGTEPESDENVVADKAHEAHGYKAVGRQRHNKASSKSKLLAPSKKQLARELLEKSDIAGAEFDTALAKEDIKEASTGDVVVGEEAGTVAGGDHNGGTSKARNGSTRQGRKRAGSSTPTRVIMTRARSRSKSPASSVVATDMISSGKRTRSTRRALESNATGTGSDARSTTPLRASKRARKT